MPQDEDNAQGETNYNGGNDGGRVPFVIITTPEKTKNENRHTGKRQQDAEKVDSLELAIHEVNSTHSVAKHATTSHLQLPVTLYLLQRHKEQNTSGGQQGQGQVQAEDPSPRIGGLGRDCTTNDGTDTVCDGDNSTEDTLVFSSLAQRNDIAYNELGNSHQTTATDTCDGAEYDELDDRLRERRGQGTEEEDGKTRKENDLAGPDIR